MTTQIFHNTGEAQPIFLPFFAVSRYITKQKNGNSGQ